MKSENVKKKKSILISFNLSEKSEQRGQDVFICYKEDSR